MQLAAGLVLVVAYLVLSINTYLETQALGVFSLGYGRLGPTEARIALIVLLAAVALGASRSSLARADAARRRRAGRRGASCWWRWRRARARQPARARAREPYTAP